MLRSQYIEYWYEIELKNINLLSAPISEFNKLQGVGDEFGERKAKEAAREIEEKAQNPPVKPGFFQRVATAMANLFGAIFG